MTRSIHAATRLSELRDLARARRTAVPGGLTAHMVRSVEQSMRVEGYPVTEDEVRLSAERVLRIVSSAAE